MERLADFPPSERTFGTLLGWEIRNSPRRPWRAGPFTDENWGGVRFSLTSFFLGLEVEQ